MHSNIFYHTVSISNSTGNNIIRNKMPFFFHVCLCRLCPRMIWWDNKEMSILCIVPWGTPYNTNIVKHVLVIHCRLLQTGQMVNKASVCITSYIVSIDFINSSTVTDIFWDSNYMPTVHFLSTQASIKFQQRIIRGHKRWMVITKSRLKCKNTDRDTAHTIISWSKSVLYISSLLMKIF